MFIHQQEKSTSLAKKKSFVRPIIIKNVSICGQIQIFL